MLENTGCQVSASMPGVYTNPDHPSTTPTSRREGGKIIWNFDNVQKVCATRGYEATSRREVGIERMLDRSRTSCIGKSIH
jgi:hypothetical protein